MKSVGSPGSDLDELARHRLIRRLIGLEVTDLIETTDQRIRESGVRIGGRAAAPAVQCGRLQSKRRTGGTGS